MDNTNESTEKWSVQKEKLKNKFAILTDNDVTLIEGRLDEMLGRIQVKLGKTNDEMKKIILDL